MKRLKFLALALFASATFAQSVPNGGITPNEVWTTSQWITGWQSKADVANPAFTGTITLNGSPFTGGGGIGANPTAIVGLTPINGVASTFMRSDAAPALSQSISPNMTGNWTFSPAAGIGINTNGVAGQPAFNYMGPVGTNIAIDMKDGHASATGQYSLRLGSTVANDLEVWDDVSSIARQQWLATGGVVFPAGSISCAASTACTQQNGDLQLVGSVGVGASIRTTDNVSLHLGTNGANNLNIAPGGIVSIPSPSVSSTTFTVTGPATQYAEALNGSTTSGSSFGLKVAAGTTAADINTLLSNQGGTALVTLYGDGGAVVGAPAGGDKGLGTLNASNLFVNGVAVGAGGGGGGTGANPTGTIGLTAVNGSLATFLRSDGAPALSQAIVPTWSGLHTFTGGLTSKAVTSGLAASFAGFTGQNGRIQISDGSGTGIWQERVSAIATNSYDLFDTVNAVSRFQISNAGAVTFPSGVIGCTSPCTQTNGDLVLNGTTGVGGTIRTTDNVSLHLGTNNLNNINIAPGGVVNIAAPVGVTNSALIVNGIGSAFAETVQGSSATGVSKGEVIDAGTNASDFAFEVNNAANTVRYLDVFGDGGIVVNGATGGDLGAGSINAKSLFINGVAVSTGGGGGGPSLSANNTWTGQNTFAPTSGGPTAISMAGASGTGAGAAFTDGGTGNRQWMVGVGLNISPGYFEIRDLTRGLTDFYIAPSGTAVFQPPTTGAAVVVNGAAGNTGVSITTPSDQQLILNAGSGGRYTDLIYQNNGTTVAQLYWDQSATEFVLGTPKLFTNAQWTQSYNGTGNAFQLSSGQGNAASMSVSNTAGAGVSYGLDVLAGTNATDSVARFFNGAGSIIYWNMHGDGSLTSSGEVPEGAGTINVGNVFVNGIALPEVNANNSWTGDNTFSVGSGTAITAVGAAGANAVIINGANSTNASYGLYNAAGTSASDRSALFANEAGATLVNIAGNGGVLIGAPTGGNEGAGTINAQALYVNGVAVSTGGGGGGGIHAEYGTCGSGGGAIGGYQHTGVCAQAFTGNFSFTFATAYTTNAPACTITVFGSTTSSIVATTTGVTTTKLSYNVYNGTTPVNASTVVTCMGT